jgi:hypothetical protein
MLYYIVLQNNLYDRWLWKTAHFKSFSIKEAYWTLTNREEEVVTKEGALNWLGLKQSSAESFNFRWRFLADWLPTKDSLFRMGILNVDTRLCSLRCGSFESL